MEHLASILWFISWPLFIFIVHRIIKYYVKKKNYFEQ